MRFFREVLVASVLALAVQATTVSAQGPTAPTSGQCQGWARALATGGPGAQKVLAEEWLAGCSDIAPEALADAIARLRTATDADMLWALTAAAGNLEHPAIFDAALQVAADRSASVAARASSILILGAQAGGSISINGVGTKWLLTQARPSSGVCTSDLPLAAPTSPAAVQLGDDAPRRAAIVIDPLLLDSREPLLLRNLARCVRHGFGPHVPPQIDVSAVRLTYLCDNEFTIYNPTAVRLPLVYDVEGTSEREEREVASGQTAHTYPDEVGTVRLYYDGRLIQSAQNTGKACSP